MSEARANILTDFKYRESVENYEISDGMVNPTDLKVIDTCDSHSLHNEVGHKRPGTLELRENCLQTVSFGRKVAHLKQLFLYQRRPSATAYNRPLFSCARPLQLTGVSEPLFPQNAGRRVDLGHRGSKKKIKHIWTATVLMGQPALM